MTASTLPKTVAALAALLIALPSVARDLDSVSLEVGAARKVGMLRVGLQSNWEQRWFASNGTHLGGYWDAALSQWRGTAFHDVNGQHEYITIIGLTPVFRFQSDDRTGWYADGGIGINLMSRLYNNNDDFLSTAFQFNDQLGVGYVFKRGWDVGLKLEHFSNGGIKKPNSGVNFVLLRVARQF